MRLLSIAKGIALLWSIVKWLVLLLILSNVLLYAICEHPKIRSADALGTWVSQIGAEIRMDADGRFSYKDLPADVLGMIDPKTHKLITGDGWWNLEERDGVQSIELHFEWIPSVKERPVDALYISGTCSSVYLYFWQASGVEGAIGDRYILERMPAK
jgi:hypothetical protein